ELALVEPHLAGLLVYIEGNDDALEGRVRAIGQRERLGQGRHHDARAALALVIPQGHHGFPSCRFAVAALLCRSVILYTRTKSPCHGPTFSFAALCGLPDRDFVFSTHRPRCFGRLRRDGAVDAQPEIVRACRTAPGRANARYVHTT